jgi:lactoylglutathione lyase
MKKNFPASLLMLFFCTFISLSTMAQKTRINHIALSVHHLQKSTVFYQQIIGLDTIPEPFRDGRHTWLAIGDFSQLHLIQNDGPILIPSKNTHLCFSTSSIAAFTQKLTKAAIPYEDRDGKKGAITLRPDKIQQIYLQDPDGYWIEINDDRPK